MLKNLKQKQEGFTIIEVMIVLVIAAVILLIVFLAVPALQRNSRNTQKKNEVSQLLSAAAEASANNNGADLGVLNQTDGPTIKGLTKVKGIVTVTTQPVTQTATTTLLDTAFIRASSKCNGTGTQPGSPRQIAIVYAIENAAGPVGQCTEGGL